MQNSNRAVGCIQNLPSAIKAMHHLKDATLDIRIYISARGVICSDASIKQLLNLLPSYDRKSFLRISAENAV